MANPYLILCGEARLTSRLPLWTEVPTMRLRIGEGRRDVHLHLGRLTRAVCANLPDVVTDLLELAAYVYAADQAVSRGKAQQFEYGQRWNRHFRFEVPMRRPDVWQSSAVLSSLQQTLGFLSDDLYEFAFVRLKDPPPIDRYLYNNAPINQDDYEEVMLFSGGLDSTGGGVQEVVRGQRKVVLVSHRSANQIYARQCNVLTALVDNLPRKDLAPLHVAVEVNKGGAINREFTQRSRSFLFAALAAVTARCFGLSRLRFYENGVISLNLPVSPQVIGGRASRTTHPLVLQGFATLFSELFEGRFEVQNPFEWKTKAEVLAGIKEAGLGRLCAVTSSCVHTRELRDGKTHCGRCSQCVDRRLSALAAGLSNDEDPADKYITDVLTSPREGADLTLLECYVGTLLRVDGLADAAQFVQQFGEVARVLRRLGMPPREAAQRVFDLYRRHARGVLTVLAAQTGARSEALVRRTDPPNCLLRLALSGPTSRRGAAAGNAGGNPLGSNGNGTASCDLKLEGRAFKVQFDGHECWLGNTTEWRLLSFLNARRGEFVPVSTIINDVWGSDRNNANVVQRAASNLRRLLRRAQITAVYIDGTQRGHYCLTIVAPEHQQKISTP